MPPIGPIFVLGFPRSGTSGLATGLSKLDGYADHGPEGHFMYLFNEPVGRIRDDRMNPNNMMRDAASKAVMFEAIAKGIDELYRKASNTASKMWIDKTPDIAQVQAIPTIRTLFPDALFIYTYRDPVSAVRSNMATWPDELKGQESQVAERWQACQAMWRKMSPNIPKDQKLEVYQPELRRAPQKVVEDIAKMMRLGAAQADVLTQFWTENRHINRPQSGRLAKDYDAFSLNDETISKVLTITQDEVARWPRLSGQAHSS